MPLRTAVDGVSGSGRARVSRTGVCVFPMAVDVLTGAVVVGTRLTGLGIPPADTGPLGVIPAFTRGRSNVRRRDSFVIKG